MALGSAGIIETHFFLAGSNVAATFLNWVSA